jgi:hypothetical protein
MVEEERVMRRVAMGVLMEIARDPGVSSDVRVRAAGRLLDDLYVRPTEDPPSNDRSKDGALPPTPESLAAAALEAKRQRYYREFGRMPSDEMLARLP